MNREQPQLMGNEGAAYFSTIVGACESFAADAGTSSLSTLDACLAATADSHKPLLLRNLMVIHIQRLRAEGQQPQVEEYLQRYPQFSEVIREAFLDSVDSQASLAPKIARQANSAISRLGNYRILGELGRGGMGIVYEAVHMQRGDRVALKTLPIVDGAALHRFKREFRVLADVNHPQLIGLHTLESDAGQWFFTMDLVEGTTFLNYVRPEGALDEARLRSALSQLVRGVMALHGQHIIHRDLKPSNVMVTNDGHVVVLDFGLALEQDHLHHAHSLNSVSIAGTPKFMAPEQAAGAPVTPASDWYAVGVMLYEALSGRLPFEGSPWQILQDKQRLDAPPLPGSTTSTRDLAKLCQQMLAREPKQRPNAFEITKALAPGLVAVAESIAPTTQRLVGREPQLAALQDVLRTVERQREPQTVFISGRSGEGKTALAEHFLAPLRKNQRVVVMSGRCYDRESVPFKALDALIDALGSYLRSLPGEDAALLMPDDIGVLAQVFPALRRVEVVAKAADARLTALDDQQVRQRAFQALRLLLSRISRRSLVVWFIDDLQWGDADSAQALFEVLRPPEAPSILFLATYRRDEREGSAFLRMWKELQEKRDVRFTDRDVKVGPLTVEDCIELMIGLVGKDDEAIRRRAAEFARETQGNTFLLIELIGCFDPNTNSFEPLPLHEVLAQKLGRLSAEAAPLLDIVAVSGQAVSLEEASRAAGFTQPQMSTIARMRNERLVRLIGPDDSPLVDTYHDRVRETVLANMDGERCRTLHGTLADVIERECGVKSSELLAGLERWERAEEQQPIARVYDLAYHYDSAGHKQKALMYGMLAAEQARSQSALEVAARNYALASRNAVGTGNAARYRMAEGYGASLMLLGQYQEAADKLVGAIDLTDDVERKARIELLQGELAFNQGMLARSSEIHEGALRRLGVRVPRTMVGIIVALLRESFIQLLHSLFRFRLHRSSARGKRQLISDLFYRLCQPYCFQNTFKYLYAHLKGMNRSELLAPSPTLARLYANHCAFMSMLGWKARGGPYGDRAIALAREFDDLWAKGLTFCHTGIGLHASARYVEGIPKLTEAIGAYEKAGDLWELHMARFHRGCCHFGLGNLDEAVAEARWVFTSSARLGDSRTMCSSWLWARATRGDIPFEHLKSCMPSVPDDVMSTVHAMLAEGYWHTFHGRSAEALAIYERAAELVRTSLCVNSHTILVMPMLAMGLRLHADAVESSDPLEANPLRKRASYVAKWSTRLTRLCPAAHPLSLRERALVLNTCGQPGQALKYADQSCAVAEVQKAKYEHAQSLLVRGRIAHQLGRPEADEQIRGAEAALDAMERAVRATSNDHSPS